jgi:N6-L-threonylcarbamoyladenine synthase
VRRLLPLLREVLERSGRGLRDIDLIAFTQGPGLGGALLVGASVAAGLALALDKPAVGIHHLEGHLLSPLLAQPAPAFPFVALLVSGGHTQLMRVDGVGRYAMLGETQDDAAGEAFDKTASLLGLGYPGGPALARLAEGGDAKRFDFPRPMIASGDLDFSFSGLKTAVLRHVRGRAAETPLPDQEIADIAASFQRVVVSALIERLFDAARRYGAKSVGVAGGVSANSRLRADLKERGERREIPTFLPSLALSTDNAAMIAAAGLRKFRAGHTASLELNADAALTLG